MRLITCILWSFLARAAQFSFWTQETQHELDTFPRLLIAFLCFPDFNFQSIWSHRHSSYPMLWVVTVAWLYIKPFRNVSSKEPTGDPVDSDPDVLAAEAALPEPTVWSQKGFATPVKLWPFSPILPVLEKYIFTLLNGAIEKFCDLKGIFLVGQVPLFFEKKNSFKIGLTVYASVPLRWFTQVCPCVKRKVFFCFFFLKIACTFALRTQKRKEPEKISRSYGLRRCAPSWKIEIACSFALHVGKRKGPRKIYFSLGVDCHPRTT